MVQFVVRGAGSCGPGAATLAAPSAIRRRPPMNWLLSVTIVLLASLALAAVHFLFTRWLTRQSEPERTDSPDDPADHSR